MPRTFVLALLSCVVLVPGAAFAQAGQTEAPANKKEQIDAGPDLRSPQALYEEANGYVAARYQEFNKQKLPFDAKLEAKTKQEQKELAAKYAERLQSRGPFAGEDLYYVGMLQHLAANADGALESMQAFLAATPEGEKAQLARSVLVLYATRKSLLSEAEQAVADYAHNQPQNPAERFGMERLLTDAFYKTTDFEHMARHARVMFKLAKQATQNTSLRDDMLLKAVELLTEAYLKQNNKAAAIAAIEEVRKIAIARPSGNLYNSATRRLLSIDPTADLQRAFEEPAGETRNLPELVTSQWIEQQPTKLSELRGQVVLLDFWAPWCGPCRVTFPKLQSWHARYKDKGLVILGLTHYFGQVEGRKVNSEQELAYLREFKKKNQLPYGFAVADSSANDINYGVYSIPTSFLIDRRGKVRFITFGSSAEQASVLGRMIRKLLAEPVKETNAATR